MLQRQLDWYLLCALFAVIVWLEKVVNWIEDKTGTLWGWKGIVGLEIIAISAVFMTVEVSGRVDWGGAGMVFGIMAAIRIVYSVVAEIFWPPES